jgi:urease subunit beta
MIPGEILFGDGDIAINEGAQRLVLDVVNTGDRPVQVGSHVHLPQANTALEFDRAVFDEIFSGTHGAVLRRWAGGR